MEQTKLLSLKNLYAASPIELPEEIRGLFRRPLTQSEIESFTIVTRHSALQSMLADETNFPEDNGVYYIPKYKKVLDLNDFYKFAKEKQNENFIMIADMLAWRTDMRAFVDSKPGKMKVTFYVSYLKSGKFTPVATLDNEGGIIENKDIKILRPEIIDRVTKDSYGGVLNHRMYFHFETRIPSSAKTTTYDASDFIIFNNGKPLRTGNIIAKYLQVLNPNSKAAYDKLATRIKTNMTYNRGIRYELCDEEEASLPMYKRLGLKNSSNSWSNRKGLKEEEVFPEVNLDENTVKRVTEAIVKALEENRGYEEEVCNTRGWAKLSEVQVKSVMALSKPLPGHRRPVYHLFRGIKHGGGIEVAEIVRGEISTSDMVPVTFYHLSSTKEGTYLKATYETMNQIREEITNYAEVDRLTFADWSERKSQNPRLINAIMGLKTSQEKGELLTDVKRFNRMSFGTLFAEQLIRTGKIKLARSLADYVIRRGDNMDYVCSSLQDIFPGSAPEETTIPKMLKMNKPCYDLLFDTNHPVEDIALLRIRYQAIKALIPDGILTKESQKLFDQYMELRDRRATTYYLYSGEQVNLLDMPEIIKPINKMYGRIDGAFNSASTGLRNDAARHYSEIVQAYITLKKFGYDLNELKVFIEFSLNQGSAEASLTELEQRERAANTAMEIYKNKIDEERHKIVEEKYAKRLKAVKRLETPAGDRGFETFWVLAPTQIYGEETDYSIEKEGAEMKHCVFRSYASDIAEGRYTVVFLRTKTNPAAPYVTIGINRNGRINQTYTEHDRPITERQAEVIAKWAKSKKGLVTFKSEGRDVNPGGWPSTVSIPDLPPVTNETWLKKLAGVAGYDEEEEV